MRRPFALVEVPADGKDVRRTVTVPENGKATRRAPFNSHDLAVTGVALIGTGGPSAPTPVP